MANSRTRRRRRRQLLIFGAILLFVLLCFLLSRSGLWDTLYRGAHLKGTPVGESQLVVRILDAGNADCALITLGDEALLIDAGNPGFGQEIRTTLKESAVEDLDYVVATHAHDDHIGGMAEVIKTVEVGQFLTSPLPGEKAPKTTSYRALTAALRERAVKTAEVTAGMCYTLGDARLEILSPEDNTGDANNQSVVCRIVYGENAFLFMGDAEKKVERRLLEKHVTLRANLIKVGHHGSKTASDETFLKAVSPDLAVITCGEGNRYGHPHSAVLELLDRLNVPVYRSDLGGKITVISDGMSLKTETEKEPAA